MSRIYSSFEGRFKEPAINSDAHIYRCVTVLSSFFLFI